MRYRITGGVHRVSSHWPHEGIEERLKEELEGRGAVQPELELDATSWTRRLTYSHFTSALMPKMRLTRTQEPMPWLKLR